MGLLHSGASVVRVVSQLAKDGVKDGLTADFVTKGVWERSRDCLYSPHLVHAGSPGCTSHSISYSSVLNSQA